MRVYDKNMQKRQNSLLLLLLREKENGNRGVCLSGDENTAIVTGKQIGRAHV